MKGDAEVGRINDYELSHLILRFEQEKDMKPMHCVQNLAALRDLVTARIEREALLQAVKNLLKYSGHKPDCSCVYHEDARLLVASMMEDQ